MIFEEKNCHMGTWKRLGKPSVDPEVGLQALDIEKQTLMFGVMSTLGKIRHLPKAKSKLVDFLLEKNPSWWHETGHSFQHQLAIFDTSCVIFRAWFIIHFHLSYSCYVCIGHASLTSLHVYNFVYNAGHLWIFGSKKLGSTQRYYKHRASCCMISYAWLSVEWQVGLIYTLLSWLSMCVSVRCQPAVAGFSGYLDFLH